MQSRRFEDISLVRNDLKCNMPLNQLISLADARYTAETGKPCSPIERVNDHLYKKKCDLDEHPVDEKDGTKDSTASFTICPPKELWHCFGCGAHGDRFEYISKKFHVDHIEAIQIVAELQGFDLSSYYVELTMEEQIRNNLFKDNDKAREIAHNALLNDERALSYMHGRGITDESIEMFKLGYAPPLDSGNVTIFNEIGNSVALQLDRKDQFNDAILFPITDVNGRMRYFQSRPFKPYPGMKYIGGNDTHPLFEETDRIFGFNISKKMLMMNGGRLVGVEGAPDCIACIQVGIPACGFLGTVVNQMTFDLLQKYRVTELTLLLDGDKAGQDRSHKICENYMALQTNVRLKVATLPDGYDPDEYINEFGADSLKEIINNAVYAIQHLIDSKWQNANTVTGKIEFMYSIQPYMNAIDDTIVRNIMINYVAGKTGLDPIQIEDYYTQSAVEASGSKLFSPDGEETLLGEAIRNPDFISELTMRFKDDDWYLLRHKHLFRILKSSEYHDVDSIATIAKNMGVDDIISYSWLDKLYKNVGNVEFSLKDVEDKLIRRKAMNIIDVAKVKVQNMNTDVALTIDQTTTGLFDTMHSKSNERVYDASQQVNDVMAIVMDRMSNPVDIIGDSYGKNFKQLDAYTLGSQKQTLTIVAANQSVGKTQICENFAMAQAVDNNIPTLWFSLEMDKNRMTFRNLSILSGLDCSAVMTGNITVEQKQALDKEAIRLMQAPFYLSERGHDLTEAVAIARKFVQTKKVEKIYVDYAQLQYVTDRRTETRSRELGVISKTWKEFAQEMDVSVILISQLGRQALEADTAEAEHGYGSYEMAQDADTYITLKDKSDEEINMRGVEHGNKTMNISKNRMGEKTVLIDIYADGPNYRMMEV